MHPLALPLLMIQVLGRVYPKTTLKSTKVVPQFKEAAAQRPKDAELWELLGDLLSSQEPAGEHASHLRFRVVQWASMVMGVHYTQSDAVTPAMPCLCRCTQSLCEGH
jgi:hypothetical protein